jgi:hypothetical protein
VSNAENVSLDGLLSAPLPGRGARRPRRHGRLVLAWAAVAAVASNRPGPSFHTSGWLNSGTAGHDPSGAALSPDGRTLYVTLDSGLETFHVSLAAALPGGRRSRSSRIRCRGSRERP